MADKPTYEELEQRVLELEKTETERKQVEEELLEPEVRLKALSEASFEAIFLSEKGICMDQNQTAERMFGYTRAEAIGRYGTAWIIPEDHEQVKNNMISGYEKPYEVTALKKDGDTFPAEIQARMTDYQGRSIRITALRDISDRKQAEEALAESEEKYKSLTNNLNVGVYRNSVGSKGKFIEANPAIVKMFGYDSRGKFLKIGVSNLYKNPLKRKEFTSKIAKAGSIKNEVLELQKKDGTEFIGSVSAVAVKNKKGDIKYFDGIIEDITERKRAEESLRESHKRYQLIVENISNVVWTMDMNFHNTFVSPSVYQQRGYTPEEVKNQPLSERMNPNSIEKVLNLYNENLKLIEAGDSEGWKPIEFEIEQPCKDGSTIWTTNTVRFLPGPDKQPASLLGTTHDITERKQAEEKLQKSEKRLKGIFESIPSPIVVYNTEGHPLYLNPAFTALFHWSLDELKGQRIPFVPDDQKELSARKIGAVYKTGKVVNYETRRLTKQGDVLDVIVSGAFVTGSDGKPAEMVAVITNVTDLKRAKVALRESEEKYRTVLEANPDPVVVYDMEGRVIYLNPAFTRVFGWSLEEQIGKKIDDFVPEKNMSETRKMINKVTLAGESFSGIETRRYTKEGNILDISISGSCYKDHEGNVAASVINLRDITEQKRLEVQFQKARKMEAMGLMAGGVAHDLNNILSGIVSYPELLLMDLPEDSPLRKPIKTIQESGMRASDVVEDLMTIARGVATAKNALNLNTIVTGYLGSAEHRRLERTHAFINFKTALAHDLLNISGSLTHINKTLMNLVTNAAEAIEDAGTVTISTVNQYIEEPLMGHEDVHTGEYVMLSVSDDGSGITPKDLERIFEPFYTKKVMGKSGTGLGLAVVWNTVQDHNGYVNVKSSEKGTVFELYFPVIRQGVAAEKENIPLEDYLGHGEKILVVDDDETQREIACGMLTKLGYSAEAVSSGEAAIEYVKEHPVDLIVLDMIMPKGINGRETYEEIIKTHPGQKAVIASGYAKTKEVDIAQELGADKYIKKPYTLEKIGVAVKEELGK